MTKMVFVIIRPFTQELHNFSPNEYSFCTLNLRVCGGQCAKAQPDHRHRKIGREQQNLNLRSAPSRESNGGIVAQIGGFACFFDIGIVNLR